MTENKYLRDVSLWTIEQLQAMGCASLFGAADGKEQSEREKSDEVMALVWVQHVSHSEDEVEAAVQEGRWQDELKKIKRDPEMLRALPEVNTIVGKLNDVFAQTEALDQETGDRSQESES